MLLLFFDFLVIELFFLFFNIECINKTNFIDKNPIYLIMVC